MAGERYGRGMGTACCVCESAFKIQVIVIRVCRRANMLDEEKDDVNLQILRTILYIDKEV
jgi:hypothetical protein